MKGRIDWDNGSAANESAELRVPYAERGWIVRNRLVRIDDTQAGRQFVGRLSDGPFHPPPNGGGEPRDALARVEIQGEWIAGRLSDTNVRPGPGAVVTPIDDVQVAELTGCTGDLVLGTLAGQDGVPVGLSSADKGVLPRNVGIFGTVGSGKSNTTQVLIEETARAGWAVLVIDVEGEYTAMDEPSELVDPGDQRERLGRSPEPLRHFAVYHPASSPGERPSGRGFTLRLADFEPGVIAELLGVTVPERNALFECIDHFLSRNRTRLAVNEREELKGLLDPLGGSKLPFHLFSLRERCIERGSRGTNELDYVGLGAKLMRLMQTQAFDEPNLPPLNIQEMITAGQVSILDVSAASDSIQNLVTADLLRKAFADKMVHAETPPTLIVIEEAHSFISKDRVASMHATLQMLRTVTRRGRKRWLSVAFVSQQPGHLPTEIFELCNTRIVHNVRSLHNLEALMATAGDVGQSLWARCPLLAPGEALLSSPQLRRPVVARMRQASSKRRFTR